MYRKLGQNLAEIITAGHHSVSFHFFVQTLCIRGFQSDIIGSYRQISILRQGTDTVLLRVEVIYKYECRMGGIGPLDKTFLFHERAHIDKVRWWKLILVKIILHMPKHLLIPFLPQRKKIKRCLLHINLSFRGILKKDLTKRRKCIQNLQIFLNTTQVIPADRQMINLTGQYPGLFLQSLQQTLFGG